MPLRRAIERHVQRDDVGFGEQLRSATGVTPMAAIELRIVANVVREDAAVERRQQPDEILADESAADDAEGAAGQLPADQFLPLAAAQRDARFRHAMQQRDRKRQRQLRHRSAIDAAGPRQLDAAPRDRLEVDAVEADAVLADHLQLRHLREHRIVDRARARRSRDRARAAARRARRRRAPPADSLNVTSRIARRQLRAQRRRFARTIGARRRADASRSPCGMIGDE